MTYPYNVLKDLVRHGANVQVEGVPADTLRELVALALKSGAHVTVESAVPYDLARELAATGGNQVTFVSRR